MAKRIKKIGKRTTQKAKQPTAWRSRIIGHGEEAPDQLLAHPQNWRVHTQDQQDGMRAILDRIGWIQRVIVNKRTGRVVDGHMRVLLSLSKEEESVPVSYVDLTEEEERLALVTFDPIGTLAAKDWTNLQPLFQDVVKADASVASILSALGMSNQLNVETPETEGFAGGDQFSADGNVAVEIIITQKQSNSRKFRESLSAFCEGHGVEYKIRPR